MVVYKLVKHKLIACLNISLKLVTKIFMTATLFLAYLKIVFPSLTPIFKSSNVIRNDTLHFTIYIHFISLFRLLQYKKLLLYWFKYQMTVFVSNLNFLGRNMGKKKI